MQVFISWSGAQANQIAKVLRDWLPKVLAGQVETWASSEDIRKGQRWLSAIGEQLQSTEYGLVVVTSENKDEPWLNFEAGALGKSFSEGRVTPLLVDVTPADVEGPLNQFQMTSLRSKDDVFRLVVDMHEATSANIPLASIKILFEQCWPELVDAMDSAKPSKTTVTSRPVPDLLEEILDGVRRLQRTASEPLREPSMWDMPRWAWDIDHGRPALSTAQADFISAMIETFVPSIPPMVINNHQGVPNFTVSLPNGARIMTADMKAGLRDLCDSHNIYITLATEDGKPRTRMSPSSEHDLVVRHGVNQLIFESKIGGKKDDDRESPSVENPDPDTP
jgi:hypothetical protein